MSKQNKQTAVATKWNCDCGAKNIKSKFCPECGKKMPENVSLADNKSSKKKWIIIAIAAVLVVALGVSMALIFTNKDTGPAKLLSFAQANSVSEMEKLDGQKVTIIGYMSTLSPVSGKFMYLMNLPYQSCPFCIPNTTQLSNTLAIYAPDGKSFEFTDRAIQVTGILEFGQWEDEFGYKYDYRIKDATFEVVNTENMSEELKMWQQIAASGVVAEIYTMYDYVSFICFWPEYSMNYSAGPDYIYPEDMPSIIGKDGYYSYGTTEAYFDAIIAKLKQIDEEGLADIIQNVEDAKRLAMDAKAEYEAGNYVLTTEYTNYFGDKRPQYKLNKYETYTQSWEKVFGDFSTWMNKWEV